MLLIVLSTFSPTITFSYFKDSVSIVNRFRIGNLSGTSRSSSLSSAPPTATLSAPSEVKNPESNDPVEPEETSEPPENPVAKSPLALSRGLGLKVSLPESEEPEETLPKIVPEIVPENVEEEEPTTIQPSL